MNSILKACLATGALVAFGAPAMAALDSSDTGNGELILTLQDAVAGRSLTYGLGINLNNVLPSVLQSQTGTVLSFNVTSQISSLLASGATIADLDYSIAAADSLPSNVTASENRRGRQMVVTGALGGDAYELLNNGLRTATGNASSWTGVINGATGSDKDGVVATSADAWYVEQGPWGLTVGNVFPNAAGSVGEALGFYYYASSETYGPGETVITYGTRNVATRQAFQQSTTNAYGEWLLSQQNGQYLLTYSYDAVTAPVPLPAAAWLLLSGLTGLGLIGRRRSAAAA